MSHPHIVSWLARELSRLAVAATCIAAAVTGAGAQSPLPAPSTSGASFDQLRATAQMRMRRDLETFTREQLREIEQLYQSANQNLRAPESPGRLQELLDKYPSSNRAGCAALYLAQISSEGDREVLLKQAIERHADAWYGDGTQVGPMARAYLASHYQKQKRQDEAVATARAIAAETPDAVDHQGRRIVDMLKGMGLLD
jgi:hypothetical protein